MLLEEKPRYFDLYGMEVQSDFAQLASERDCDEVMLLYGGGNDERRSD